MSEPLQNRFVRQQDLVPAAGMELSIGIIGVGAIGRQVGLQLAAMGARRVTLIDFDVVDDTNRTTQGYRQKEVGLKKVEALADTMLEVDDTIQITKIDDRFRARYADFQVAFCCVDSIDVRKVIWQASRDVVQCFVDGRMLGETIRVLAVSRDEHREYYPTTFFASSEAQQGRCTARSTIYTASIAAGLMLQQFTRHIRNQPVDADTLLNLLASELSVAEPSRLTA